MVKNCKSLNLKDLSIWNIININSLFSTELSFQNNQNYYKENIIKKYPENKSSISLPSFIKEFSGFATMQNILQDKKTYITHTSHDQSRISSFKKNF